MRNIEKLVAENAELKAQNALLQEKSDTQEKAIAHLSGQLASLQEMFRLSQQKRFGSSSEQTDGGQLTYFNEVELEAQPAPEPKMEQVAAHSRKTRLTREAKLDDLPQETVEHRLDNLDCSCGGTLHEMSVETHQNLKIIPAQVIAVTHKRFIYACRNCEKENGESTIVAAPMPKAVLPGSLASPSSAAHILSQKYAEGMPLYRQEQNLARFGVDLSRQTMANWAMKLSELWLRPLYENMHERLLREDILHCDETTVQVLKEPGREATSTSYMWLYRTGRDGPPIVLFDYQTGRAGKHAITFLEGFKGYLHVDGYAGYHAIPDVTLCGCWSHARRGFTDAVKALPPGKREGKVLTDEAIAFCDELFRIERSLCETEPDKRLEKRKEESIPVLQDFKAWLSKYAPMVTKQSALGKAITYCRNQWPKLVMFLEDGRLELSNNSAERAIRPFVVGRKGWLFCNAPRGAKASATIYSIVETAKENGLNPYTYLEYLFEAMPNIDISDPQNLERLLPWSKELPARCRSKKQI